MCLLSIQHSKPFCYHGIVVCSIYRQWIRATPGDSKCEIILWIFERNIICKIPKMHLGSSIIHDTWTCKQKTFGQHRINLQFCWLIPFTQIGDINEDAIGLSTFRHHKNHRKCLVRIHCVNFVLKYLSKIKKSFVNKRNIHKRSFYVSTILAAAIYQNSSK